MEYLLIPETVSAALFDIRDIAHAKTPLPYGPLVKPDCIRQIAHPDSRLAALKIGCFIACISRHPGCSTHYIKTSSYLTRLLNKCRNHPEKPEWNKMDRLDIKRDNETLSIYGVSGIIVPNGKSRSGSTGAIRSGIVTHFTQGRRLMDDFIEFFETHNITLMEPAERGVSFAYQSASSVNA